MKKFILNRKPDSKQFIKLDGDDYHYLVRVRRLAVGEFFPALLPDGEETLVQIISIDRGVLTGKCVDTSSSTPRSPLPTPSIILFQALPKGDKMDLIVRQAAEGGIAEIVPFVSEFSVARIRSGARGTGGTGRAGGAGRAGGTGSQKFSRWERIIKEARQQSGSKTPTSIRRSVSGNTRIENPLTMKELFDYWTELKTNADAAIGLLFHHQGLEQESLHCYLNNIPQGEIFPPAVSPHVVIAIGPEGGFSDSEVSLFLENGFKPFTIGDTILRTETAALYCAAAVKIILLERDSWKLKK